ncbi:reverse transcriptase domain-containing protein [Tanacetum coccineum]
MKKLITDLPSLTPPREKETLYEYLAVSAEAVSTVLLTDRKGRQCPVQYVSRTLNEAERNYTPMEKLALSLIHMTRRLRRYFKAHPIKVIIDQLIKNILNNTETLGKLAKYAVELGAYNITFIPRNAVNGQVLEDFLSEAPEGEEEELYFRMPEPFDEGGVSGGPRRMIHGGPRNILHTGRRRGQLDDPHQTGTFQEGVLMPMLRSVGPLHANYIIREIHIGSCGMHIGPRVVVRKAIRQGYYWPTMHEDAKKEVEKCYSCQIHALVPRLPKTLMTSIMAPWPFYQWGMDILGSLPPARGGAKFVIVAIDYFTKWIEAKPLVKITGKGVIRFVMENIICRFGLPQIIVTDNGAQLVNDPFKSWCGREAVIPAEIGIPTYRTLMIREEYIKEEIRLNLDLLQERRETAAVREARYKIKMEQYYNKKIRPAGFRPR